MSASTSHWRLIINGKVAADEALRAAAAALRADGVTLQVQVTWEHGDAGRFAAEAIEAGVDVIAVAGGDGTLNAVVAALAGHAKAAADLPSLSLAPMGTANDFASAAGIPNTPEAALQLAARTPATPIDLLRLSVDGRPHWAVNLASGGFGADVTAQTREGLKNMIGGLAYLLTGIARLGRIEPVRARLRGPDFTWEGGFIALGVGNGRQAGGGQVLCPEAKVDDGVLEVTIVPELSGELGAAVATLLSEGKHAALERVAVRARLPWVEIDGVDTLTLNLDGEPLQARHFRIECVPGRICMHLPQTSPLLAATPTPG